MSDRPIQVGDLVVIVQSCCNDKLGLVGIVKRFKRGSFGDILRCDVCGSDVTPDDMLSARISTCDGFWRLDSLKRIPPLSKLESIDQQEPENV